MIREDGGEANFFGIENASRAGHFHSLGNFRDGAFFREIAAQDDEVAVRSDGTTPRMNDVLILARLGGNIREGFRDGLAGDGESVAVQDAVREQDLHDLRNAAGGMQFRRDVRAGGLHVAEHRNLRANSLEIVERERHVGRVSDGHQVQDGVGRAADGVDDGDRHFRKLCAS